MQRARFSILSYLSDLGLWWYTLAALEALLTAENLLKSMAWFIHFIGSLSERPFFSLFSYDCYENNAIWWRHLAPKKVAPILNVWMDLRKKLIDCNTVSDGYFDTLWVFVDAF